MPNTREKLIEVKNALEFCCRQGLTSDCNGCAYKGHNSGVCMDVLMEDAIAVINCLEEKQATSDKSKWISVKERLPEIVSTHKRYRSTIKKSIRVLCVCVQKSGKTMVKEGYCEWYNDYPEPRWQIPGTIDEVTHWQYLPQPPKGE